MGEMEQSDKQQMTGRSRSKFLAAPLLKTKLLDIKLCFYSGQCWNQAAVRFVFASSSSQHFEVNQTLFTLEPKHDMYFESLLYCESSPWHDKIASVRPPPAAWLSLTSLEHQLMTVWMLISKQSIYRWQPANAFWPLALLTPLNVSLF